MSNAADKAGFILRENLAPFILEYASEKSDIFWLVSVVEVKVSKDYSYADFYVSSVYNQDKLTKYLSQFAWEMKSMIWRDLWARKSPTVRFKISKVADPSKDVLSIIKELSDQYGLN